MEPFGIFELLKKIFISNKDEESSHNKQVLDSIISNPNSHKTPDKNAFLELLERHERTAKKIDLDNNKKM